MAGMKFDAGQMKEAMLDKIHYLLEVLMDEELPTLATTLVHEARRFVQPARRKANTTQQHAI